MQHLVHHLGYLLTDNAFPTSAATRRRHTPRTPVSDQNPTAPRPASSSSTVAGPGRHPRVRPRAAGAAPALRRRRHGAPGGHVRRRDRRASTRTSPRSSRCWTPTRAGWTTTRAVVSAALGRPAGLPQYAPDGLEKMIAEQSVDVVDRDRARPRARRARGAGARRRGRRRRREAADHRPARLPADHGRGGRDRPGRRHDVQLPLRPAELLPAPGHRVRRDRRGHVGALRVGARHRARRRLLPPLAPREEELRRPAGAQVEPPLRPGQLVARATCRPASTPAAA